ncbi:protein FAR1-RELATED SEQUENCE 5-like [Pyrus ussuriensis x Pyrus communis]|uniref:Protein FAR1-RELATED SEQUENCE 5-like n=1 Tax=Pyrus ussuriensis x Pyrus communis TaxID=2448454 RepID=A0A5N5I0D1_9ROSA|nr:protein FAR1-RELATED SEQUENCE 5-like [Pyrus ussuriensis x Pyrus communis]
MESNQESVAAMTMEFEEDLTIGMVVHSNAEAFQVRNAYALRKGFNLRKGLIRRDKSNNVMQQDFLCSKEGFPMFKDLCNGNTIDKLTTQIGCKALIRFSINQGLWKTSHVDPSHNHELAKPEERQFLRLGRNIHDAHAGVISSMVDAEEVGGDKIVGFTKIVKKICIGRKAMKLVEKRHKAKKASDKVKKKNSLSTSTKGVTNKRLKIASEKLKKVAKQHNQETINAPSNMTTSYSSFHDFYNQQISNHISESLLIKHVIYIKHIPQGRSRMI